MTGPALDAVELAFLTYRDARIGLRAAVDAARFAGCGDDAIAARLGVPVGTVEACPASRPGEEVRGVPVD